MLEYFATSWKYKKKIFFALASHPLKDNFRELSLKNLLYLESSNYLKMPEVSADCGEFIEVAENKKSRFSPAKLWSGSTTTSPAVPRTLELEGVIEVLREYEAMEGSDINCCICGEFYIVFQYKLDCRISVRPNFDE